MTTRMLIVGVMLLLSSWIGARGRPRRAGGAEPAVLASSPIGSASGRARTSASAPKSRASSASPTTSPRSIAPDPQHAAHLYVGFYCVAEARRDGALAEELPARQRLVHRQTRHHDASTSRRIQPFTVNSYIVENGIERQLVVYWYQQSGGRIVTNEYLGRVYLVLDSLTRNRSDAALIRVSVPFDGDPAAAAETARAFLRVAYPALMRFLPHDALTSDAQSPGRLTPGRPRSRRVRVPAEPSGHLRGRHPVGRRRAPHAVPQPGPEARRVRARVLRLHRRAVRDGGQQRHRRAPSRGEGARHPAGRRGHHLALQFRRLGQLRAVRQRGAGVRRHRSGDVQPRSGADRAPASRRGRARSCRCTSSVGPRTWTRCSTSRERHDLRVIEDACEALGARWRGRHVGTLGDVGTFAFYPNKQITTGEGGMIVTDESESRPAVQEPAQPGARQLRRLAAARAARIQLSAVGHQLRARALAARCGSSRSISGGARWPRSIAGISADIEELELPLHEPPDAEVSWFVYVVRLKASARVAERDDVLAGAQVGGHRLQQLLRAAASAAAFSRAGLSRGRLPDHGSDRGLDHRAALLHQPATEQIARISDVVRRALASVGGSRASHAASPQPDGGRSPDTRTPGRRAGSRPWRSQS